MRIVYFGNNQSGLRVLRWLKEQKEEIVGLVVHPPETGRWVSEIVEASGLEPDRIWLATSLSSTNTVAAIKELRPDLGVSVNFAYILRKPMLGLFQKGAVNLHTAYLPYNRGANPNVWSIIEGTPAGVTPHFMDEGIDTGDIIAQERVEVSATDTGASLYRKLEETSLSLFKRLWPEVKDCRVKRSPQQKVRGTCTGCGIWRPWMSWISINNTGPAT